MNLEGGYGYLSQNHDSTRMSMPIIGDNQTEHGTIGDLFRIGIHQRGKMSFQFKNQIFFIILTFLGMSIIITGTHLEEMRMSLLQGLSGKKPRFVVPPPVGPNKGWQRVEHRKFPQCLSRTQKRRFQR